MAGAHADTSAQFGYRILESDVQLPNPAPSWFRNLRVEECSAGSGEDDRNSARLERMQPKHPESVGDVAAERLDHRRGNPVPVVLGTRVVHDIARHRSPRARATARPCIVETWAGDRQPIHSEEFSEP